MTPPVALYSSIPQSPERTGIKIAEERELLRNMPRTNSEAPSSSRSQYSQMSSGTTAYDSTPNSSFFDLDLENQFKTSRDLDLQLGKNIDNVEQPVEPAPLPDTRQFAWLRYTGLNLYRRLFTTVFLANLIAFFYVVVADHTPTALVNAAAANLLVLGLARQPLVVNLLFITFSAIPRAAPLRLRRIFAKVYTYGGVHSGCGVATLFWYTALVGVLTQRYVAHNDNSNTPEEVTPAILGLAYVVLVLLMAIIIVSYPTIRSKIHDYFGKCSVPELASAASSPHHTNKPLQN